MIVDGIGDRPVVDSGGFPVVWLGGSLPIGQDPNQGGTNVYGPGDVVFDAETGDPYQIGGDWHLRPLGGVSAAAPASPGPVLSDHFYYVDHGEIIEKTAYSDGTATFNDTGMQSGLADGSSAGDPWSLAVFPRPVASGSAPPPTDPYNTQQPPSSSGAGGFQSPNPVGGYGPYATPSPPQLSDRGTYVQAGELFHHQVDQYGNDYYTDLGPAPAGAVSAPTAPRPSYQPPSVPSPRAAAPSIYRAPPVVGAPITTYTPPRQGAAEPVAADGQTLSGQSAPTRAAFNAIYGPSAAAVWVQQHNAQLGAPQSGLAPTTTSPPSVPISGQQGPSGVVGQTGGPVVTPRPVTTPDGTPAITTTGNPNTWAKQAVDWLTRASFISGVPNGLLVAGGYLGASMLRRRRRF
jgi:hypothetical protein